MGGEEGGSTSVSLTSGGGVMKSMFNYKKEAPPAPPSQQKKLVDKEMKRYIQLGSNINYVDFARDDNPEMFDFNKVLKWWKERATPPMGREDPGDSFPILARMARDYLAISGASVEAERLFSKVGAMVSPKRASLIPPTIRQTACLQNWMQLKAPNDVLTDFGAQATDNWKKVINFN
ncbi:hypothetical protein HDU76_009386 [Blyttiomyces sp. JEL0837]|nr:hypothetical protein HDU76_009386 [Blyttiomyces sp. JEL0837]